MSADFLTTWDPASGTADWSMAGPDLATDSGLRSAVIVSLFTDRLAEADDVLPDDTGNRRGWWGDSMLDGSASTDFIGSRLWLLRREKATEATRQRAVGYAQEALAWMIRDGVAAKVDVQAQLNPVGTPLGTIALNRITISRTVAGQPVSHVYDDLWSNTL